MNGFEGSRLILQLKFEDPFKVSIGVSFWFQWTFWIGLWLSKREVYEQDFVSECIVWDADSIQVRDISSHPTAAWLFMYDSQTSMIQLFSCVSIPWQLFFLTSIWYKHNSQCQPHPSIPLVTFNLMITPNSAFAMNRFWGMIRSLQIILMLPLSLVNIPPNV